MTDLTKSFYLDVGKNIERCRKNAKLSAEELGNRIGVTKKTIRRYETGDIRINTERLEQLSNALDVSVEELVSRSSDYLEKQQTGFTRLIEHYNKNFYEKKMLSLMLNLNKDGKKEAIKRIDELTMIPKYTTKEEQNDEPLLNAAHARPGATDEDMQHDDDIMDDENF